MDLLNKKVLVVTTTDDMIGKFLIPHIKQIQNMGATVVCACNKRSDFFELIQNECKCEMQNFDFTRFPFTPSNVKAYGKLKKFVKQNNFDLIFCHQPVGGVFGRMIAKKFNIPVIYVAHGFHFFKGAPIINKILYKGIEKHYAKYTDALVVMNEEDYVVAKTFKAKSVFKINGIGVDLNKYKIDKNFNKQQFRQELGLNANDFVVVSVGELNKNKNTLKIVSAISQIEDGSVKYVVCGEGPLKSEFETIINKNGLQDRIKLLGFRKDIPLILNASDCFVMPSYREGLPKSMMEAMAYKMPIVASNIRGCVDLVGDNQGGLLVDPNSSKQFAEAIVNIHNDKNLAQKFGDRNFEFIKNFDIDYVLKQMEEIYKSI